MLTKLFILFVLFSPIISTKLGQFVHISDIHLDLNYGKLPLSNFSCWSEKGPKYGSEKCDSPLDLVQSTFDEIKRILPNPDFIVYTGDSYIHINDSLTNTEDLISTIKHLTDLMKKKFPGIPAFPALGNHDYWPTDQLPDHWNVLYENVAQFWKEWLGDEIKETLQNYGYYDIELSPGHTLLGLNTNLYKTTNNMDFDNENDPGNQLDWMENKLLNASNYGYKVHIIGHVPPGAVGNTAKYAWYMEAKYQNAFVQLLMDYKDTIGLLLFGHAHKDSFRLISNAEGKVVNYLLIASSITPWANDDYEEGDDAANPSFRIFHYDKKNFEIQEISTYFMNLSQSNLIGEAVWNFEYNFTTTYNIKPPITSSKFESLLRRLKSDTQLFKSYFDFNSASVNLTKTCDYDCQQGHLCAMEYMDFNTHKSCLEAGKRILPWLPYFIVGALLALIVGVVLVYLLFQRPKMQKMAYSRLT